MKKKLWILLLAAFTLTSGFFVLHPKKYIHISPEFERWHADKIHKFLHLNRKWMDPSFRNNHYATLRSNRSLDVVIPIVEKDLITAKDTIQSVRAHVFHPLRNIYLVAPESAAIRRFAEQEGCIFVLENQVVPHFDKIKKLGGWIVQQFIKLNVDMISDSHDILVIDADTVLLRNQVFIDDKNNMYTFHVHSDYALSRKDFTNRLLKTTQRYQVDFVAHHMIFSRQWLKEMKDTIQTLHGKPWYEVLYMQGQEDRDGLSEYDIYASYVTLHYPKNVRFLSSANGVVYRDRYQYLDLYRSIYAQDYKSISSHSFMNAYNVNQNS